MGEVHSVGVNTLKCCCGPSYFLYVGSFSPTAGGDTVYKINPSDGSSSVFRSGLTSVMGIAVDPTTGYVYTSSNTTGDVVCSDSSGNTVWSNSAGAFGYVAVSNEGYVYAACGFNLRKFDALTGTEVVAGGWPYTLSSPGNMGFFGVAVDQVGNVYAGGRTAGAEVAGTIRGLSVDSATATLRWNTPLRNAIASADSNLVSRTNVAVNAAGTECLFTRVTNSLIEPTIHSHYEVSSTTGGTVGSTRLSASSTGIQNGVPAAAYGPLGNSYGVASQDSSSHVIVKDVGGTGYFVTQSGVQSICIGRDGKEIYTTIRGAIPPFLFSVGSILDGWQTDLGHLISCIAPSDGLIGAFGL